MNDVSFRIWLAKSKVMSYPNSTLEDLFFTDGEYYEHSGPTQKVEIMLNLGLKDKKKKKIFDGDIIKIKHPHKNRQFIGAVEFGKYSFFVKDFFFSHFDDPTDIFSQGTEYIEVIGNIYQNPELLKKGV